MHASIERESRDSKKGVRATPLGKSVGHEWLMGRTKIDTISVKETHLCSAGQTHRHA